MARKRRNRKPKRLNKNDKRLVEDKLANCSSNQYVNVTVESGNVKSVEIESRSLGYCTLGLSMLITAPYVIVYGENTKENVACCKHLSDLSCAVVNNLISPFSPI